MTPSGTPERACLRTPRRDPSGTLTVDHLMPAPASAGSVIETAATPLDGFNTGCVICGIIMLAGGIIGMALMRPEREALRFAGGRRLAPAS